MVGMIAAEVDGTVLTAFEEIDDVEVGVFWDPPWTLERSSERRRRRLSCEGKSCGRARPRPSHPEKPGSSLRNRPISVQSGVHRT